MAQETKQPAQQEIQPTGTAQTTQTAQPVQPKAQPAQTATQPPVKKKSKWWIWLIVALIVVGIGVAAYFIFIK